MTRSAGLGFGELRQSLQNLGLGRAPIVVAHVSLRSFGRVDGGARTVIAALRSLVPTVVVPTFTYETMLPAPPRAGVPNNAAREAASWDDFLHALGAGGGRPAWLDGRELQRRFGRIPAIEPHIRPWQRDAMVGSAHCRAVPARIVIQVAHDLIRRNPAALLRSNREPGSRLEAALLQYLSSR